MLSKYEQRTFIVRFSWKQVFSIYRFHLEQLPTTVLLFWSFIIWLLGMVYLEIIDNMYCSLYLSGTWFSSTINARETLPTTMLAFIVDSNSSVTTVHNELIADIKCQGHFIYWDILFTTKTRKLQIFMIAFLIFTSDDLFILSE